MGGMCSLRADGEIREVDVKPGRSHRSLERKVMVPEVIGEEAEDWQSLLNLAEGGRGMGGLTARAPQAWVKSLLNR